MTATGDGNCEQGTRARHDIQHSDEKEIERVAPRYLGAAVNIVKDTDRVLPTSLD